MVACLAAMMMSLTAQAKTQDVGGRVIDQNGEPLGFVSVALLSADSTYIQGATSDENGAFMIQTTDACCILRLSFIGYRTQYANVKGSDVGTIQMEEDQPLLSEIIVKGQMPKTKLTGNSMVTTIQGTILGTSGTAKEICAIFLAMATGLATGMGYLGLAAAFTAVLALVILITSRFDFGTRRNADRYKSFRIVIPEDLDYSGVFDDLFAEYTTSYELVNVRTTNMGSMFRLTYDVTLKDPDREKELIDKIRCRNGNLEINVSRQATAATEL